MQQTSLNAFLEEIEDIQEYIKHIELINQIEKNTKYLKSEPLSYFNKHLSDFHTKKKLFEYKAITISLYGILEKHISIWIKEHIGNLKNIVDNYNDLPKKITQSHFDLSIKLISLITENRYSKFENINRENILLKLNNSICNPKKFELNKEAYIPLSGNLKHQKIIEAFNPLNINLDILRASLNAEIVRIDDLVSRRNDIAHGVDIDSLLGISEFEDYINALKRYMTTIFDIITQEENQYFFQNNKFKLIGTPNEFFHENTVCIINIENIELKVGDELFMEKDNKYSKLKLIDIQKDDISIDIAYDGELGLKFNSTIKNNAKIYKQVSI